MAEVYGIIEIVFFCISGIFGVISIFIWFKNDIWQIYGDLSGRNAKKTIKKMRLEKENQRLKLLKERELEKKRREKIEKNDLKEAAVRSFAKESETTELNQIKETVPLALMTETMPLNYNAELVGSELVSDTTDFDDEPKIPIGTIVERVSSVEDVDVIK